MTTRKELRFSFDSGTDHAHIERVIHATLARGYAEWAKRAELTLEGCIQLTDPDHRDLIVLVQDEGSMLPFDSVACVLPHMIGGDVAARIAKASVELNDDVYDQQEEP